MCVCVCVCCASQVCCFIHDVHCVCVCVSHSKQGSIKKPARPTRAYLEHRVQQLEESLEARDKECSKKLRAMQQKCTTIEVYMQ